jgi:DNA-binding NarL/FixJ family response regulator
MNPLTIALVDDQELFMESLKALFGNPEWQISVLWTARNGEEALAHLHDARPDVVLMDYFFRNHPTDGGETARMMLEIAPNTCILMLSVSCELPVIRESLQKGALGYASKEISTTELLRAIRTVARGEYFLDQTALRETVGGLVRRIPRSVLTRREGEVAALYVKGLQIREIAASLFISEDTVESHIKNIRSKTGAGSRYEVAEYLKRLPAE